MFSAILNRVGIKGTYVPFMVEPDQLGHAVQSLKVLNIAGANVTVPYKEKVMPHLDAISEGATIIGAVNTIVRNGIGSRATIPMPSVLWMPSIRQASMFPENPPSFSGREVQQKPLFLS